VWEKKTYRLCLFFSLESPALLKISGKCFTSGMTPEHGLLKNLVESISPVPAEDWNAFSDLFTPFTARRKEQLTLAGDIEKYLYFVCDGVQRVYYIDDQQREATIVFTYAPLLSAVSLIQWFCNHHRATTTKH
jgi:hypothetical protein